MNKNSMIATGSPQNDQTFRPIKPHISSKRQGTSGKEKVESIPQIDLRQAVKLPEGEDLNEWLAKNVSDFYRQVSMLYSTITEFCTDEHCPVMSAGPGYRYLWSEDQSGSHPAEVTAPQYIIYLLKWIDSLLENEEIFPSTSNAPFPDDFIVYVKNCMKRLFRFYAHCYYHHLENFQALKMEKLLNTSFKHFIFFSYEFNLISQDQLEPLRDYIELVLNS
ncbi:Mob1/phocein family protein [Tritrichomonas foetus]|uniref:Mob1/phocein family protein n=1 Tax=Tritrichomonas foetus TaxID=1144522 RepID=A0A1J4JJZ0_9EUKA|nr:Mob1/phocein family protein [Tritrichomonas foetus]|eukprot:OHS99466.1 Mob1/phocein family protein [Tritrichomonas foetus]